MIWYEVSYRAALFTNRGNMLIVVLMPMLLIGCDANQNVSLTPSFTNVSFAPIFKTDRQYKVLVLPFNSSLVHEKKSDGIIVDSQTKVNTDSKIREIFLTSLLSVQALSLYRGGHDKRSSQLNASDIFSSSEKPDVSTFDLILSGTEVITKTDTTTTTSQGKSTQDTQVSITLDIKVVIPSTGQLAFSGTSKTGTSLLTNLVDAFIDVDSLEDLQRSVSDSLVKEIRKRYEHDSKP